MRPGTLRERHPDYVEEERWRHCGDNRWRTSSVIDLRRPDRFGAAILVPEGARRKHLLVAAKAKAVDAPLGPFRLNVLLCRGALVMTVSLEAMLRRVLRIVGGMFAKSGSIDMTWLVQNADGAQQMLVTPVPPPEHISAFLEELREVFRRDGVTRYARAMECWAVEKNDDEYSDRWLATHGSLATYPKRREIVLLDADDGVAEYLLASSEILRPEGGGKPYLGKLSEIGRLSKPPSGWFTWMLDVRPTTELADDEGNLFVTDVPGAPFQVFGRRGSTGELFVSPQGVVEFRKPIKDFVAETGFAPEIVTGPEAERLLAKVQRRIVKQ
jgi:hypothetical protein